MMKLMKIDEIDEMGGFHEHEFRHFNKFGELNWPVAKF